MLFNCHFDRREKSKDHCDDKNVHMIIHDTMGLRLLADARSDK